MTYACAAATGRRADMLATIVKKMMRNRCGKCINTLERQHVNRRVLIRKRLREHVKNSTSCLAPTAQYHCEPGAARPRLNFEGSAGGAKAARKPTACARGSPPRTQRVEDNEFTAQPVFSGVRARLISKRITQ